MQLGDVTQDYYGMKYFAEKSKLSELTIFIVDDNKVYQKLFRQMMEQFCYSVHTFGTGEEALEYSGLKPDLVFMDYHLDGVNPYAKKGDEIGRLFKKESPKSEVVMVSSDEKFKMLQKLNFMGNQNVIYKDKDVNKNLVDVSSDLLAARYMDSDRKYYLLRNVIIGTLVVLGAALVAMML